MLNVVSHRLNTKETLLKFSRKLTLNHIGESLGSRGRKLRKPKMKTFFWCHRNDAPNLCSVGCPFQSQNLGIWSLKLIRTRGKLSPIPEWLGSQRAEVGSKSYARLNFTDLLATRLVVDMRYGHVRDPEGWT